MGCGVIRGCQWLPKEKILTGTVTENTDGMETLLVLEHAIWLLSGAGKNPT